METSRTNRIVLAQALAVVCLSCNSAFSQENISDILSGGGNFLVALDGASNPELISHEALFLSLSGLLEGANSNDCSNDTQIQGISATPPCLAIEGVDLVRAAQLAQEFKSHIKDVEARHVSEFCEIQQSRRIPYLSREEFSGEFDFFFESKSMEKSNFFLERGNAILGQESMNQLVNWANDNLRRSIFEQRIDMASLLESSEVSPERFSTSFCSSLLTNSFP